MNRDTPVKYENYVTCAPFLLFRVNVSADYLDYIERSMWNCQVIFFSSQIFFL